MRALQKKMNSKIGPLFLVATDTALTGVFFESQNLPMVRSTAEADKGAPSILSKAETQLKEYFEGKRQKFDLPLEMQGSEFQKRVWRELLNIPYGQTCSYRDIAKRIHNEKAMRAVGSANGKNPLTIIVPCHRVIAANNSLGGYTGGLDKKTILLDLEQRVANGDDLA